MAKRKKLGDPKVAIAYMRCSTTAERQALGLEDQRQAIASWAAANGVTIAFWFTEEVSGGAPLDKRTGLLEALAAVPAASAGIFVVHRLDRFSRDPLTAALAEAELRRHGASLATADGVGAGEDPAAKMIRNILLAVAEFEKALIKARIKGALAVKRRAGARTGTVPYGYASDGAGRLSPDAGEQAVISTARELRATMTLRAVAAELAARGVVGRTGRPLAMQQVHRMLAA